MHSRHLLLALGLVLSPAAAFAQSTPASPPADSATAPKAGGVTRDEYIRRAQARAAKRFDQMDTDHDGILTRDERQAWRQAHPRKSRSTEQ